MDILLLLSWQYSCTTISGNSRMDASIVIVALIASLFNLPGIAALYIAWKNSKAIIQKTRSESAQANGEAAESFANTAQIYAKEVAALKIEMMEVRRQCLAEIEAVRKESFVAKSATTLRIEDLERKFSAVESENKLLKDWTIRLSYQIRSFGQIPVPFESKEEIK
jgi:hypothetical protein